MSQSSVDQNAYIYGFDSAERRNQVPSNVETQTVTTSKLSDELNTEKKSPKTTSNEERKDVDSLLVPAKRKTTADDTKESRKAKSGGDPKRRKVKRLQKKREAKGFEVKPHPIYGFVTDHETPKSKTPVLDSTSSSFTPPAECQLQPKAPNNERTTQSHQKGPQSRILRQTEASHSSLAKGRTGQEEESPSIPVDNAEDAETPKPNIMTSTRSHIHNNNMNTTLAESTTIHSQDEDRCTAAAWWEYYESKKARADRLEGLISTKD